MQVLQYCTREPLAVLQFLESELSEQIAAQIELCQNLIDTNQTFSNHYCTGLVKTPSI